MPLFSYIAVATRYQSALCVLRLQLAVGLVTKGLPCLRLFSDDKEEIKVYEMFADAFMPMQVPVSPSLLSDICSCKAHQEVVDADCGLPSRSSFPAA